MVLFAITTFTVSISGSCGNIVETGGTRMFSPKHGFCYSLNLMTGPDAESLKAIHSGPQNKISLEFNIESKEIQY